MPKQENRLSVLHCHTTASDGVLSHEEVLAEAAKYDIGTIAFTDHDTLIDPELFEKLKSERGDIDIISGIEVSANYTPEVEGEISLFHIIGLFVDPTNMDFREYCRNAKEKRLERSTRVVSNLNNIGFRLSVEEVLAQSEDGNIGRPHIVRALLLHPENLARIESLILEFKVASESDPSLREAYEVTAAADAWGRVFGLVLTDRAFKKGIYVPYLHRLSMDEAVALIRGAGGIAILAHWSYIKNKLTPEILKLIASQGRLDGIENAYAFISPEYNDDRAANFSKDRDYIKILLSEFHLAPGGGGDLHKPEDFHRLTDPINALMADDTRSFIDDIKKIFPNHPLGWSTLSRSAMSYGDYRTL